MAKNKTTVPTYTYVVYTDSICTITDTDSGRLLLTAVAGVPNYFTAQGDSVTLSDDAATILKPVFKCAPAALGLIGGGPKLPPGYTRLDFLESTGTQYIDTGYIPNDTTGLKCRYCRQEALDTIEVGMRESASSDTRFYLTRFGHSVGGGFGWGPWYSGPLWTQTTVVQSQLNWLNSRQAEAEGEGTALKYTRALPSLTFNPTRPVFLFAANVDGKASLRCSSQIFELSISQGVDVKHIFQPALTPSGSPCMFELVGGKQYPNKGTGQFVAGVGDMSQLVTLLRNLPGTGGSLTLSLPAEANIPEVADMMQQCHDSKGWTLTVYEYRPAAVATYSLRRVRNRVWCRKRQDKNGSYVDASGTRWQVERCSAIFGRLGQDPSAYGYEPFDSVAAAAEHWQLVPYEAPEDENLTNE